MGSKTSRYIPKTIYLDNEDIEKLDEIVEYTGLNPSQIFRRILAKINKEDLETKEEKFKRLSKSGRGKLIKKPSELENIHMNDLKGVINDGKNIDSVKAVRQIRKGDSR
jgi:hypothetical protein